MEADGKGPGGAPGEGERASAEARRPFKKVSGLMAISAAPRSPAASCGAVHGSRTLPATKLLTSDAIMQCREEQEEGQQAAQPVRCLAPFQDSGPFGPKEGASDALLY